MKRLFGFVIGAVALLGAGIFIFSSYAHTLAAEQQLKVQCEDWHTTDQQRSILGCKEQFAPE